MVSNFPTLWVKHSNQTHLFLHFDYLSIEKKKLKEPEMCNRNDYIIDYPNDYVIDYLIVIVIVIAKTFFTIIYPIRWSKNALFNNFEVLIKFVLKLFVDTTQ